MNPEPRPHPDSLYGNQGGTEHRVIAQTPGEADHAPKTDNRFKLFLLTARKAVLAFIASGLAGGFGEALANFDFTNLTWSNLWTGLVSALVGSILVYVIRNKGSVIVDPALQKTVEQIIREKFGTHEIIQNPTIIPGTTLPDDKNHKDHGPH